jgi:hypothetical protein
MFFLTEAAWGLSSFDRPELTCALIKDSTICKQNVRNIPPSDRSHFGSSHLAQDTSARAVVRPSITFATSMASSPQKRSADSENDIAIEPATKRRHTALRAVAEAITAALQTLQGDGSRALPAPVATLLASLVDACLCKTRAQRSGFSDEVADMLRSALSAVDERLCRQVETADAELDAALSDKASQAAAEAAAIVQNSTVRAALREKKERVVADVTALKEATDSFNDAVVAQETGDTKIADAKALRERLEEAASKTLAPLKEGQVDVSKVKKQAKALAALCKKIDFDESLTSGLAEVLAKKPDARSEFDATIIGTFEIRLKERIAECEKTIAEEVPEQVAREKAVADAKAKQDEVEKQQEIAQGETKEGQTAVRDAQIGLLSAQSKARSAHAPLLCAKLARDEACAKLRYFREGPMATFDALRTAEDEARVTAALERFAEFAASPPKLPAEGTAAAGA